MDCDTEFMADWDAARYHQVSDPQRAWGRRVLDRLAPSADEGIVDIGCGSGRLTADLHARVNGAARITAADRSWTMVTEARRHLPADVSVVQSDATAMPFKANAFDAVFSTATFHWISDHATLFAEIHRVLRPGGRLVAQAGGGKNLETLYTRTNDLSRESDFAEHFIGWRDPWTFAGVDDTVERLERAGPRRSRRHARTGADQFSQMRIVTPISSRPCACVITSTGFRSRSARHSWIVWRNSLPPTTIRSPWITGG